MSKSSNCHLRRLPNGRVRVIVHIFGCLLSADLLFLNVKIIIYIASHKIE